MMDDRYQICDKPLIRFMCACYDELYERRSLAIFSVVSSALLCARMMIWSFVMRMKGQYPIKQNKAICKMSMITSKLTKRCCDNNRMFQQLRSYESRLTFQLTCHFQKWHFYSMLEKCDQEWLKTVKNSGFLRLKSL